MRSRLRQDVCDRAATGQVVGRVVVDGVTLNGPVLRPPARVLALVLALAAGTAVLYGGLPGGPAGATARATSPATSPALEPDAAASPRTAVPAPPPPRNDVEKRDLVVSDVLVRTSVDTDGDGRRDVVRVVLTRPPGSAVGGRRVATVVHASPYYSCCKDVPNHDVDGPLPQGRPRAGTSDGMRAGLLLEGLAWARKGYAFARVASLGSNRSTGCPTVGDGREAAGPVAAVDWLNGRTSARTADGRRARATWATGAVGMVGASYDGTLASMAAATGVRGLRAIVPSSGISSWYDYYRRDGLVVAPGGYQGEDTDVLAEFDYTRRDQRVCDDVIAGLASRQDRDTGDVSGFWTARDLLPHADRVRAGVLVAHGFGDDNVRPDQAARWYAALRRAGAPVKIWWDQGGHGTAVPQGLVDRWFDHFLYGVDNGVEQGPRAAVTSPGGRTHWYRTWPRPGSRTVTLRPGGDGDHLVPARDGARSGRRSFTDDASIGAADACKTASPAHVLRFRSAPYARGLDLSGTPVARLRMSFDATAANVTAGLCLSDGSGSRLLTAGWTDPQNVGSPTSGTPLEPGRSYDLTVRMNPVDRHLPAGSRITLVVMSSDHDATLRPPAGTGCTLRLAGTSVDLPVV